ncbi:haloacid dehalogenase-like hydrolase domain-containing protein At3g48420 isoform X2 [Phalaenopsis equestris]|uniref:haloacid dehalogenase-like hydrolase domain-containing protein At3g48420 isoform X2 n=1 Tax=Phalaenopsis equestris TaxID=78828 RepID=UPI0009E18D4D|nr:haloacid dehalogenase-like hydrolase domain-containing protein At3g48420 isoform X2 [Phalaenopsis equestris]
MATVAPSPGVSSTAPGLRRNFRSSITSQTSPLPKRATTLFSSVLVFSGRWGGSAPIGFGSVVVCAASSFSSFSPSSLPAALLFDCDGVLVDTEKDGHRISFNETFDEGLRVTWDVKLYGKLLKIGGGKERMTAYFNQTGWPEKAPKTEEERIAFVASLHKRKTELFMALIEKKLLPLRPGVERLIDDALTKGVKVAVCSTSNEKAVSAIVSFLLGPERADKITIFAGDVVPRKKPDPAIYLLAANTFCVEPSRCVVVEDSAIGLAAVKAAGMKCIITKSGYTAEEDFADADAIFDCIGDPPEQHFDLAFCTNLLNKQYVS